MASELTKSEVALYSRFKETIVRAAEDATNALVEIHDRRLYRHEFATFDDFCQAFGKSVRTVTNKIAANRVDFNISAKIAEIPQSDNVKISATVAETRSILPSVLPNLSQAAKLALAKLPEDKQSGALADAVDKAKERGNDTPTTADVKEVVKLYQAQAEPYQDPEGGEEASDAAPFDEPEKTIPEPKKPKPEKIKDANGKTVPEHFNEVFTRGSKAFKDALALVTQLKKAMNAIAGDELIGTIFAAKGTAGQAYRDLDNIRNALRFSAPSAVCPYCKGDGCKACLQAGWVGERVNHSAPPEMKQ